MKKKDRDELKKIIRELLNEMKSGQTPTTPELRDSLDRRKRPIMKDDRFLFYCNKIDLGEFKRICSDILHKKYSEVLREKVNQVLKDAGVVPKDKG